MRPVLLFSKKALTPVFLIFIYLNIFAYALWFMGSWFPDQALNSGPQW